jgi:hypothetical protein
MGCTSHKLPLLLERAGVRRIKSTSYIPLIPAFSLKGEGEGACVNNDAQARNFTIEKLSEKTI